VAFLGLVVISWLGPLRAIRSGSTEPAVISGFLPFLVVTGLMLYNLRFYRLTEAGVEVRGVFGTKQFLWSELEAVEPWYPHRGVSMTTGYTVRAAGKKFWVVVDSADMEEFIRLLNRRVRGQRAQDRGDVSASELEIALGGIQKAFVFGPAVVGIVLLTDLAMRGHTIVWLPIVGTAWYVFTLPLRIRFTPTQIEISYLGRTTRISPDRVTSVYARTRMFRRELVLQLRFRRLVLPESIFGFRSELLAEQIRALYGLPSDKRPLWWFF
jgi:hypothetical protein